MRKQMKKGFSIIMLLIVLVGCNASTNSGEVTLNLAKSAPSNSLNNMVVSEAVNFDILNNTLEGLLRKNLQGEIEEGIAEKYEVSEDKTVYTFYLRDTKWSDGTAVTAQDFVFSWGKVATLEASSYSNLSGLIKNGVAVTKGEKPLSEFGAVAKDDKTLVVTLEKPTPYFPDIVTSIIFAPTSKAFYDSVGEGSYGTSADTVLSNGPYKLSEYAGDSGYKFVKNPDYWDIANVQVDVINVRVIPSLDTQAVLFDNGEIDRLELADALIDKYANKEGIEVQKDARTQYMYLSGTTGKPEPLLLNKNFRAAVAHSIDKEIITDTILKDGSLPADGLIPSGFVSIDGQDYRDVSGAYKSLYYNKEKALSYLEAAKAELGDTPLAFTLHVWDREPQKKAFQNIGAQIEQTLPGVKVTIQSMPAQSYFPTLYEYNTPAAYAGWGADFDDPISFFDLYTSKSTFNFPRYSSPVYDEYVANAESAELGKDPMKRWQEFFAAESVLLNDYVVIPLYQKGNKIIVQNGFQNFTHGNGRPVRIFRLITKE